MPHKPNTLARLAERTEDPDALSMALLDAWQGATITEIIGQVVGYVYEVADELDLAAEAELDAYAAVYDPPPGPYEQVPEDLLDPQTLLAAVKRIEMDAERSGDTNRAEAAANIRECLRDGDIHRVAKALVEVAEQLEDDIFGEDD